MSNTKDKTWWLQLKVEPEKLRRVRLISRDAEFVTLESVGGMSNCWMLQTRHFNQTWRTWKRTPTSREMGRAWDGWKGLEQ